MTEENQGKTVGATVKAHVYQINNDKKYFQFVFSKPTAESLDIEKGDLLEIRARNMKGLETSYRKKVGSYGQGKYTVTVPSKVAEELDLSEKELVDVFLSKV